MSINTSISAGRNALYELSIKDNNLKEWVGEYFFDVKKNQINKGICYEFNNLGNFRGNGGHINVDSSVGAQEKIINTFIARFITEFCFALSGLNSSTRSDVKNFLDYKFTCKNENKNQGLDENTQLYCRFARFQKLMEKCAKIDGKVFKSPELKQEESAKRQANVQIAELQSQIAKKEGLIIKVAPPVRLTDKACLTTTTHLGNERHKKNFEVLETIVNGAIKQPIATKMDLWDLVVSKNTSNILSAINASLVKPEIGNFIKCKSLLNSLSSALSGEAVQLFLAECLALPDDKSAINRIKLDNNQIYLDIANLGAALSALDSFYEIPEYKQEEIESKWNSGPLEEEPVQNLALQQQLQAQEQPFFGPPNNPANLVKPKTCWGRFVDFLISIRDWFKKYCCCKKS